MTLFLAIFLSSFMIFTIFTVGVTYFKLQKIQNIRLSGAEFDAIMYGVTGEQAQKCGKNPDITLTGFLGLCGWVEKTDRDGSFVSGNEPVGVSLCCHNAGWPGCAHDRVQ